MHATVQEQSNLSLKPCTCMSTPGSTNVPVSFLDAKLGLHKYCSYGDWACNLQRKRWHPWDTWQELNAVGSCAVSCFLGRARKQRVGAEMGATGLSADRENHNNMACVRGTSGLGCRHRQGCCAPLPLDAHLLSVAMRSERPPQPLQAVLQRAQQTPQPMRPVRLEPYQREGGATAETAVGYATCGRAPGRNCACLGTWTAGKHGAVKHAAADSIPHDACSGLLDCSAANMG